MYGRHITELDTPSLCIDLDTMESNLQSMARFIQECGKHWRPHVKCHKTPTIAHRQLAAGAIGVTSAKVSEAEAFVRAGVPDVLIANMIFGEPKWERVASLCHWGDPIVACDHYTQAEGLATVCRRRGVECRVILEVNIGLDRVGVRPGADARDLARGIGRLKGVKLVGIMGYEGHLLTIPDAEEKQTKIRAAMDVLGEVRDQMLADGLCCDIVSAGGTGSYQITSHCDHVTELQAGGGIFADPFYRERCGVAGLTPALKLLATVVSRPKLERAILDTGRKTVHPDIHMPTVVQTVEGRPISDAKVTSLSAEHLTLELGPDSQDLKIGDRVILTPGYSDHTSVLHNEFICLRGDVVESVWPIAARGFLQ